MPGINISTAVRTGPTSTTVRESSQAFFVGKAFRGPTDRATLITGMEQFELHYGGYINGSYLYSTVETLFEELFSNNIIDRNKFDEAVLIKIKKLEKQFKEIEKEDIDYSKLFKGPIGEA